MTAPRRLAALLPAALVLVMAVTGCSTFERTETPVRDESGAITETTENTDVFALRIGDCILDPGAEEEVTETPTVPCSEPHDFEAFHTADIAAETFPGDEAVSAEADQVCYDAFGTFVGMSYDESVLGFTYYVPTAGSWEAGDREILCLIGDPEARTSGSLAGAAR